MALFKAKVKTVQSVYASFTAGLEEVMTTHADLEDTASRELDALKAKMDAQELRAVDAARQVEQARQAIKNIGKMLGVEVGK